MPVLPWVARNAVVLGRPALTYGYDSHTLVQRIAFDEMTWGEWGRSFVCWLPDGNATGRALFAGTDPCARFGWSDRPDTFYEIGQGPLMQETVRAAGGWEHHLDYLLTHFILREPLWHAAVTLPLALRGAWVEHYWGLVLAPCCLWLTGAALRRLWRARSQGAASLPEGTRRAAGLLVLALPAWFMLLFNAAVAVNQVRYNLMLIPPFALSGALLLDRAWRRLRRPREAATLPWQAPPRRARLSGSARLNAAGRRRS